MKKQTLESVIALLLDPCEDSERLVWLLRPGTAVGLPHPQIQEDLVQRVHPQIPLVLGVGTQPDPAHTHTHTYQLWEAAKRVRSPTDTHLVTHRLL